MEKVDDSFWDSLKTFLTTGAGVGFFAAVYAGIKWVASTWKAGRERQTIKTDNQENSLWDKLEKMNDDLKKEKEECEKRHFDFVMETRKRDDNTQSQLLTLTKEFGLMSGRFEMLENQHNVLIRNQEKDIGMMAGAIAAELAKNQPKIRAALNEAAGGFEDKEG